MNHVHSIRVIWRVAHVLCSSRKQKPDTGFIKGWELTQLIICEHDFAGWFDSLEKDFFNIRSSVTNSCVPVKISCPKLKMVMIMRNSCRQSFLQHLLMVTVNDNLNTNLWQSMHNVVMQAGHDKIASLEGTFSTFCLDFFAFFLFSESWLVAEPVKFGVFIFCCAAAQKKDNTAFECWVIVS